MTLFKAIKILPMMAVLMLSTVSCEYKQLDEDVCYESNSIQLEWDNSRVDSIPRSYRVVFYPADAGTESKVFGNPLIFDVYNNTAILNDIPTGNYNITAWNTDTEHNIIMDFSARNKVNAGMTTFYVSNRNPQKILDSLYYNQPIYNTPDYMLHANKEMYAVKRNTDHQRLVLETDSMCVTVKYKINGIIGLHLANQVRAAMNNVTKTRFIAYDNATVDTCAVMTESLINPEDSTITGSFYLYGMEPQDFQLMDHTMTVFFWLQNRNIYFPIKINKYLLPYRKEDKVIYLEIPDVKLDLYKYLANMGGWDVDVEEWEDINIDIKW